MWFSPHTAICAALMIKIQGVSSQTPPGTGCVSEKSQAYTMDFGPYIDELGFGSDLGKALAPSSGKGCNMILGPVVESGDSVSYGNPFPYYTSKKHKDMQRLRPTANGITPGPLPPGIIAKKVEKTDIWLIVEDLDVVDKNKDLVQTTEGWSYSMVYRWKDGKRERGTGRDWSEMELRQFSNPYEHAVGDLAPELIHRANKIPPKDDTKEAAAVRHELGRKFVYLEPQQEPVQCPGGVKG